MIKLQIESVWMYMKKYISSIICLLLIVIVAVKYNSIVTFATDFFTNKQDLIILSGNEYTKNNDYLYVQRSKNFTPLSKQDVLNIYYSIIRSFINWYKCFYIYILKLKH